MALPLENVETYDLEGKVLPLEGIETFPVDEQIPQNVMQPEEESYIKQIANVPKRTLGAFTEGLAQSANQLVAAPLLNVAGGIAQGAGYIGGKIVPQIGNLGENLAQKAYEARDYYQQPVDLFNNAPEDTVANISKKTGEMFLPMPGGIAAKSAQVAAKEFAQTGAKAFPHLTRDAAQAIGGGTALETLKDVPLTGNQGIDDTIKSIFGMSLGSKIVAPQNAKIVSSLDKTIESQKKKASIGEAVLGRALSIGAKPDKELLDAAKAQGVELPFNVKLGSQWGDFFANNVFKSIFVSKAYKDVIKNAHKGMFEEFQNNINKIHPKYIEKDVASQRYREALGAEKEAVKAESSKLYDEAAKALTEADQVVPHNTLQALEDIKDKFNVPAQSEPMRFVNRRINKLQEEWSTSSEAIKTMGELKHNVTPEIFSQIEKKLQTNAKSVPLEKLVKQRSALLNDIDYGEKAQGIRAFIKPIIAAIDKDIMQAPNKEFSGKWRAANAYYKNEWADRIKTDMARSLLDGEIPKDAIQYMSSPQEIRQLTKILGNIPRKGEIMNGLRKAKFQQVVIDSVTNSDGTLSYANLANAFTKKSTMKPLLKELSGPAYEGMNRLAKIAQAYVKSGKELANPSGTALVQSDFDKIGKVMQGILAVGAGAALTTGAWKTAGTALAAPYVLSKVVSNQRYVDAAVQYALARQQNNLKKAASFQRRMEHIFGNEILSKAAISNQIED